MGRRMNLETGMQPCHICYKPKGHLTCELCLQATCKKCTEKLSKDAFSFLIPLPSELSHQLYCLNCYDEKVLPAKADYDRTMRRARNIAVYVKNQSEETRLMPRSEKPIKVECADKDEALLRLAFVTVQKGHNAILDVNISALKVRDGGGGYQRSVFTGTGIPTHLDKQTLEYGAPVKN